MAGQRAIQVRLGRSSHQGLVADPRTNYLGPTRQHYSMLDRCGLLSIANTQSAGLN